MLCNLGHFSDKAQFPKMQRSEPRYILHLTPKVESVYHSCMNVYVDESGHVHMHVTWCYTNFHFNISRAQDLLVVHQTRL